MLQGINPRLIVILINIASVTGLALLWSISNTGLRPDRRVIMSTFCFIESEKARFPLRKISILYLEHVTGSRIAMGSVYLCGVLINALPTQQFETEKHYLTRVSERFNRLFQSTNQEAASTHRCRKAAKTRWSPNLPASIGLVGSDGWRQLVIGWWLIMHDWKIQQVYGGTGIVSIKSACDTSVWLA